MPLAAFLGARTRCAACAHGPQACGMFTDARRVGHQARCGFSGAVLWSLLWCPRGFWSPGLWGRGPWETVQPPGALAGGGGVAGLGQSPGHCSGEMASQPVAARAGGRPSPRAGREPGAAARGRDGRGPGPSRGLTAGPPARGPGVPRRLRAAMTRGGSSAPESWCPFSWVLAEATQKPEQSQTRSAQRTASAEQCLLSPLKRPGS